MDVYQLLSGLLFLVLQGNPGWGQDTCGQCDCKLSSTEDERAIFNLRTRCHAGSIEWSSAYGAIRLEVQPFLADDYKACLVLHSRHTLAQVSQEEAHPHPPPSLPHRHRRQHYRRRKLLQSRSSTTMTPLLVLSATGKKSEEVCVVGRARQSVLLFVEVERTNQFTGIPSLTLQYDVQPLSAAVLQDPMEECRPCSQDELLEAYCTSDFVAVGKIHEARAGDDGHHTHIKVAVAQLVHQNVPVFGRVQRDDRFLFGTIVSPTKCGVQPGKEDQHFLFTGRMRLGQATLRCAPYFDDWLKISSSAECVYD